MFADEINYWRCMLEGDQNAFLHLYNQYYRSLFRYGFCLTRDKELTKDCIQELFLELWNRSSSVNKNVQDVRNYLFTWLRRKIHKTVSTFARQKTRESKADHDDSEESYEELLIAFQTTEHKKERLTIALGSLTKKQLQIIKMRYFDNLSYAEIAARTLLTNRTIYNTISEAIRQLRSDVSVPVQ